MGYGKQTRLAVGLLIPFLLLAGCFSHVGRDEAHPKQPAITFPDLPRIRLLVPYTMIQTGKGWGFRDAPFEQAIPSLYATLWSALLLGDSLTGEQIDVIERLMAKAQGADGAFREPGNLPPLYTTWLALFTQKELQLSGGDHRAVCRYLEDHETVRNPSANESATDLFLAAESLRYAGCDPELANGIVTVVLERMADARFFQPANPLAVKADELLWGRTLLALGEKPNRLSDTQRKRQVEWMKAFPAALQDLDPVSTITLWSSFHKAAGWYGLEVSPPAALMKRVEPLRLRTGAYAFKQGSGVPEPQLTFEVIHSGLEREPNLSGIRHELMLHYVPGKGWSRFMDGQVSPRATYWALTMAGLSADEAMANGIDLATPCATPGGWEDVYYCIRLGRHDGTDLPNSPMRELREAFFLAAIHRELGVAVSQALREQALRIASGTDVKSVQELYRTTYIQWVIGEVDRDAVGRSLDEFRSGQAFSYNRRGSEPDLVGTYFGLKTAALLDKPVPVPARVLTAFRNDEGFYVQPDGSTSMGIIYMGFVAEVCLAEPQDPICDRAE